MKIKDLETLIKILKETREKSIKISSLNEIIDPFVQGIIDSEFERKLDPPYYIAVKGKKLVDLRTGDVRERIFEDYCTKEVSVYYNPNTISENFNTYIKNLTLDDINCEKFLQRVLGYTIIGSVNERKMFVLHGDTSSGKSMLSFLIKETFGNYFSTMNKSILIDKKSDVLEPFLGTLEGKRIGIINGINIKDSLNIDKIKNLVIKGNYTFSLSHNKIKEIKTKHTLFLLTNYKPHLSVFEKSIWESLVLVNFKAKFVEKHEINLPHHRMIIKNLDLILKEEVNKEAFFNWVIQGAIEYYKNGLQIPQTNIEDMERYLGDEIDEFISDNIIKTKNEKDRITSKDLYLRYCDWCRTTKSKNENHKNFSIKIHEKGYCKLKTDGKMVFCSIKFLSKI